MLTSVVVLVWLTALPAPVAEEVRVLPYRERVVWTPDVADWQRDLPTTDRERPYKLTLKPFGPLEGGTWALRIGLSGPGDSDVEILKERPGCGPYITIDAFRKAVQACTSRRGRDLVLRSSRPHSVTLRLTNVMVTAEPYSECADCESLRRVEMDVAIDPSALPDRQRRPTKK
jgi:hypothetical protein